MANRNLILPHLPAYLASEDAMLALGAEVGRHLSQPTVLGLEGPLGAGKTCFVRGLVGGLGADVTQVASPTFPLVHEYVGGRLPIIHLDLYRIGEEAELRGLGLEDYWAEEAIIAIEWGARFAQWLPPETHWLSFEIEGDARRVAPTNFA